MSADDMDTQTAQLLEEAQRVAKKHYITLSAYERANPQIRVLSELVAEFGAVPRAEVTLRTVDTRSLNKEIIALIMGPRHNLGNLEQIEMLQAFAEAASLIRLADVQTADVAPHQAPADAAPHQAPTTPAARPDPAKLSKDRKLFAAELKEAVLKRSDHHVVVELARRWKHMGAKVLQEELENQCNINAPRPEPDQTMDVYATKLPLVCAAYRRETLAKQIETLGNGKGIRNGDTALSTVRLVRGLAELTVPRGAGDPEDRDRTSLGALLKLLAYQSYAPFFRGTDKDSYRFWEEAYTAISHAHNKQQFEAACKLAEETALRLTREQEALRNTSAHHERPNTTHHTGVHHATTEERSSRSDSAPSQREIFRALAYLSPAQCNAILETALPELPVGHCGFCRKPGHREDVCRAKKLFQGYAAGVRPN